MATRWATLLWLAVATLLGWSLFDHLPYADLDRSWALGLHLAHLDGYGFGGDVVFNYGPLGFVARPMAGTGSLYAIGVIATLLLTVVAAWLVFSTLEMLGVALHARGAATALVLLVAPAENLLVELLLVLGAVWLVTHLRRRGPPMPSTFAALGVGVVVLSLIKVSVAPPGLLVVGIAAAVCGLRHVQAAVIGAVLSGLGVWVVAGQRLGDIPAWVRGVADVASGHVSAMNTDDPSRRWEYIAVAVIAIVVVGLVADRRTREQLRERDVAAVLTVVVGLLIGWFVVRQGFTRHGARTRLVFFTASWMVAAWSPWSRIERRRRTGLALAVAGSSLAFVLAAGSLTRLVNPVTPLDDVRESARLVVSSGYRETQVAEARSAAQAAYAIPDSMLATIGSQPVLVEPIEIGAAWAYDLTWTPMVTLQRYISYTDELDRRNAAVLTAREAPPFVLRQRFMVIDGRYAPGESPRFNQALLCEYDVIETGERWDLLRRVERRCGEPRTLSSVELGVDGEVAVPAPSDGHALLVSIDFERGLVDRLASVLLKPIINPNMTVNGQPFRTLPATSTTPALLSVPPELGWDIGTGLVPDVTTIGTDTPALITFSEMPVST